MMFTLLNLLRNQEMEMDVHFEVRMKLRRERPEREPFFSRLVHAAQDRVLECVEGERPPRRALPQPASKTITGGKMPSGMKTQTRAKKLDASERRRTSSADRKQRRHKSNRKSSFNHRTKYSSEGSVCIDCCPICAQAENTESIPHSVI